jgi:hypothetical protein
MTLGRLRPSGAAGGGARPGWIGTAGRILALLLVFTVLPVAAGEGWSGHDCPHHGGHGGGHGHDGPGSAGYGSHGGHHSGHHAESGAPTADSGLAGGGHEHGSDGGPCTCVGLCTLGAAAFAGAPDPVLRVQPGSSPERVLRVRYRGRIPSAPLLYALPRANAPPRA